MVTMADQLRAAFPALAHTVYLDTAGASDGSAVPPVGDGQAPFPEAGVALGAGPAYPAP
jgi:hypothetical protein